MVEILTTVSRSKQQIRTFGNNNSNKLVCPHRGEGRENLYSQILCSSLLIHVDFEVIKIFSGLGLVFGFAIRSAISAG